MQAVKPGERVGCTSRPRLLARVSFHAAAAFVNKLPLLLSLPVVMNTPELHKACGSARTAQELGVPSRSGSASQETPTHHNSWSRLFLGL